MKRVLWSVEGAGLLVFYEHLAGENVEAAIPLIIDTLYEIRASYAK